VPTHVAAARAGAWLGRDRRSDDTNISDEALRAGDLLTGAVHAIGVYRERVHSEGRTCSRAGRDGAP